MTRKLVIELMLYMAILIIAIIMLFGYKPEDKRMLIPKDFKLDNSNFKRR